MSHPHQRMAFLFGKNFTNGWVFKSVRCTFEKKV